MSVLFCYANGQERFWRAHFHDVIYIEAAVARGKGVHWPGARGPAPSGCREGRAQWVTTEAADGAWEVGAEHGRQRRNCAWEEGDGGERRHAGQEQGTLQAVAARQADFAAGSARGRTRVSWRRERAPGRLHCAPPAGLAAYEREG